jgi:hypothetical protein
MKLELRRSGNSTACASCGAGELIAERHNIIDNAATRRGSACALVDREARIFSRAK